MALKSLPQFPMLKGLVASNQPLAQPKGSVQRLSNLLMSSRGALTPVDGSLILYSYNGAVQSNRGRVMANFLFQPTGVPGYYLSLIKALDIPLGPPQNLASSLASGGSLPSGTKQFYVVTAIDGVGGETTVSNEVNATPTGSTLSVSLTWNVVPNATGYRVYRGTSSGAETLLSTPSITSNSFTDTGYSFVPVSFSLASSPNGASVFSSIRSGGGFTANYTFTSTSTIPYTLSQLNAGSGATVSGASPSIFNGSFVPGAGAGFTSVIGGTVTFEEFSGSFIPSQTGGGGTISFPVSPPSSDTTQQVALFKMPTLAGTSVPVPLPYSNSNIVALFPADNVPIPSPGGGGGSGGGGGTGAGGSSGGSSYPSGGVLGNLSPLPQFKQFTNQVVMALGNGFPPQVFSDSTGTPTNPATQVPISAISVDGFGVVTVTTSSPHGISSSQVGGNVLIAGVTNSVYDMAGPTISIVSTTQYKVRNLAAIGQSSSSGGTSTTTALPIISTFTPSYPVWSSAISFAAGDLIVPATQPSPAIYLTCVQSGTTGSAEPTWPTGGQSSIGDQIHDNNIIWQVSGLLNSAAPAPPGAAHIAVYSGALWVFNTSPNNTANGLDGPTSLRMSSINNLNSWNPVNQAFLDKDDGTQGEGLAKFTITALGIPPEGTLVAFKDFVPYQILGVFGATNFGIQPVSSNMGCTAPRTIVFVPGFGIARMTHLGISVFNGVQDQLISEQIRPYLFPLNDKSFSDIAVVDSNYSALSWGAMTANPPQYVLLCPVGNSQGTLTRAFLYDLVLKAWAVSDFPFALSTIDQFLTLAANPVTVIGGFVDGAVQRWQAGDEQWYTGGGSFQQNVSWSVRSLTVASEDTDQAIYTRRLVVTGINSGSAGNVKITVNQSGSPQFALSFIVPANGDFDIDCPVNLRGKRFDAIVSGSISVELDGLSWELEPRPAGVVVSV